MATAAEPHGYRLVAVGEALEFCELPAMVPGPEEVIVEVAGCGVCHTDIGFAIDGVPTRHPLPLILGHEIAGRVIAVGEEATSLAGQSVLVPAVIPCGRCPACLEGRATICREQFMPGNDGDGGFATHVRVPARYLCPVPEPLPAGIELADLSVVADAVTTPYEAIQRAQLTADDVAVFVGVGGIGGFGVQISHAIGAAVVAIDVDAQRLELAAQHGADLALDASSVEGRDLKRAVRQFAREDGRKGIGLRIFETSGTPQGQTTAFDLLDHGGYLAVVGFTPKKVEVRLSNLMALDARAQGNWGCLPENYPPALAMVLDGRIAVRPFIEHRALDEAPAVVKAVASHETRRRPILVP